MKPNINNYEFIEPGSGTNMSEDDLLAAINMQKPSMEMGDARVAEEAGQFGEAGTSRVVKPTPKAMPKAAPKPQPKAETKSTPKPKPAEMPTDVTKMSLADRAKASREKARSGSGTTDTRSVGERIRSALAGKDRGGNSVDFGGTGLGMKSGGKVTASSRADGIAQRGKTRGKMC